MNIDDTVALVTITDNYGHTRDISVNKDLK
jgi:hypothetical protein